MPPGRVRVSRFMLSRLPAQLGMSPFRIDTGADLLRHRPPRTARTNLITVGHCMLPAVDATLHRAAETSLTAAWRGAVRLGRDDGDGIEGNTRAPASRRVRAGGHVAERRRQAAAPRRRRDVRCTLRTSRDDEVLHRVGLPAAPE